jgi:glycosyltransferase involved in cell wall biosynthesis
VRFLIDVHHIGAHQTGNETWARNISRELVSLMDSDELFFGTGTSGRSEVAELTGQAPVALSDSAVRRVAVDLPRRARQVQADALLVQYTKPLTRRPCVVMIHDLSPFDPHSDAWLSRRFRIRVRASINHSVRHAALLLVPSEFTRRGLVDRYKLTAERVLVAPNAIDPGLGGLIDHSTRRQRPDHEYRVIAVGNVLPRKNLVTVGEAVARMRAGGRSVELRVVGTVPPSGQPIEHDLRAMLGDAVTFTGYVSEAQLADEYVNADVLAFPSLFEGFGIPAIEAMYAGVPVVASNTGSLPEVVGDAGVVLAPRDVDAWSATLTDLLTNIEARQDLSSRGRQRARALSWTASAATVLKALRQVAARPRAATTHERVG